MDTDLFMDLLTWFIKESGHGGYSEVIPPDECPNPVVILQEDDNENSTDDPVDPTLECKIQGKTYYLRLKIQHKLIWCLIIRKILLRQCSLRLLQQC